MVIKHRRWGELSLQRSSGAVRSWERLWMVTRALTVSHWFIFTLHWDVIHAAEVHSQQPTISFGQTQTYAHKMNWRKCCTWLTAVTHSGVWNQLWSDWRCLWFPSLREDPPNPPLPPLWIYSEKRRNHESMRDSLEILPVWYC